MPALPGEVGLNNVLVDGFVCVRICRNLHTACKHAFIQCDSLHTPHVHNSIQRDATQISQQLAITLHGLIVACRSLRNEALKQRSSSCAVNRSFVATQPCLRLGALAPWIVFFARPHAVCIAFKPKVAKSRLRFTS